MKEFILSAYSPEDFKSILSELINAELVKILPQKSESPLQYLNRKETAKIFGISLPTLDDWTRQRRIPCIRIGRHVKYKKSDIETAMESFTVSAINR